MAADEIAQLAEEIKSADPFDALAKTRVLAAVVSDRRHQTFDDELTRIVEERLQSLRDEPAILDALPPRQHHASKMFDQAGKWASPTSESTWQTTVHHFGSAAKESRFSDFGAPDAETSFIAMLRAEIERVLAEKQRP